MIDRQLRRTAIRKEKAEEDGGKNPRRFFLTHGHYDHIGAVREICAAYQIPCWAMEAERELLASTDLNLSRMFGHPMTLEPDENLRDGQELTMAGRKMLVLGTPGHTAGSASFYFSGGRNPVFRRHPVLRIGRQVGFSHGKRFHAGALHSGETAGAAGGDPGFSPAMKAKPPSDMRSGTILFCSRRTG